MDQWNWRGDGRDPGRGGRIPSLSNGKIDERENSTGHGQGTSAMLINHQIPRQTKDHLNLHKGLLKAENSLVVQICTGKTGLRGFLFERRVPDIASPVCLCGNT